jgi:hypothetical protein
MACTAGLWQSNTPPNATTIDIAFQTCAGNGSTGLLLVGNDKVGTREGSG